MGLNELFQLSEFSKQFGDDDLEFNYIKKSVPSQTTSETTRILPTLHDEYVHDGIRFRVGSIVTHSVFGPGTITLIQSDGDLQIVSIAFEYFGPKKLMSKFANLELH